MSPETRRMTETAIPRRPVGARLATVAAFLVDGVGVGAWAASVPALRQSLGLTDSALSLSLLAFAAGAITAMPATGWLLTRVASRRATIVAAAVAAFALLLPGLAPSLPLLVAAAFVFGMGKGFLDVSMNTYAAAIQRAWRAPIMSSFHAAFSVGGLLGSVAMGLLFSHGLGVRTGLTVMAMAALPLVGVVAALAREVPDEHAETPPQGFVWPSRALLGVGLLCFLSMLIEGAMADWSGVYLATVAGASTAGAAAGYAAFSVMMVTGRLGGDWTIRRLGGALTLRLGAAAAAVGLALALSIAAPATAVVGFALVGLGAANIVPLLFTVAARSGAAAPGAAIAMAASVGYAGFLLGPPAIGFAADHVGLRLALALLFVAAAFIAVFAARAVAARPGRLPARRSGGAEDAPAQQIPL
jgi:MFS family permease